MEDLIKQWLSTQFTAQCLAKHGDAMLSEHIDVASNGGTSTYHKAFLAWLSSKI